MIVYRIEHRRTCIGPYFTRGVHSVGTNNSGVTFGFMPSPHDPDYSLYWQVMPYLSDEDGCHGEHRIRSSCADLVCGFGELSDAEKCIVPGGLLGGYVLRAYATYTVFGPGGGGQIMFYRKHAQKLHVLEEFCSKDPTPTRAYAPPIPNFSYKLSPRLYDKITFTNII